MVFNALSWLRKRKRRAAAGLPCRLRLEELEGRQLLSATDPFPGALPITPGAGQPVTGLVSLTPSYYAFRVVGDGRFTARVAPPTGGATRLTLLSPGGDVLLQSDGQSPNNPNDLIDLHLTGDA